MRPDLNLYAIILSVGLTACALSGYQGYRFGVQQEGAKSATLLLRVNQENAEKQKVIIKDVIKVAENAEIERAEIEDRLADANDALMQLRRTIDSADSRGDTSATCIADARTARTLLAQCAGRYKDVAGEADKLRAVVIGLQSYIKAIRINIFPALKD